MSSFDDYSWENHNSRSVIQDLESPFLKEELFRGDEAEFSKAREGRVSRLGMPAVPETLYQPNKPNFGSELVELGDTGGIWDNEEYYEQGEAKQYLDSSDEEEVVEAEEFERIIADKERKKFHEDMAKTSIVGLIDAQTVENGEKSAPSIPEKLKRNVGSTSTQIYDDVDYAEEKLVSEHTSEDSVEEYELDQQLESFELYKYEQDRQDPHEHIDDEDSAQKATIGEVKFELLVSIKTGRAIRRNRYWASKKKLNWGRQRSAIEAFLVTVLKLPSISSEKDFVKAVAAWQNTTGGLGVDGIIGPNTWARLQVVMNLPETALSADLHAIVDEIIKKPRTSKQDFENRFGTIAQAELLRTLAAWHIPKADRAYQKLIQWNIEFLFKWDETLQKKFIGSITALRGTGSVRVRADVALSILDALSESKQSTGAMLAIAGYFSMIIDGSIGAQVVRKLEINPDRHQIQRIISHILIWDVIWGSRNIGKLLGQTSYLIAQNVTNSISEGRENLFDDKPERLRRAQSSLLGRLVAHVELAVDDWAESRKKDVNKASAAHGASIVLFAIDAVMFLLPGPVSFAVKQITSGIRKGVERLEARESARSITPVDPRKELNKYMLAAANLAFIQMMKNMHNRGVIDEDIQQILVEQFRLDLGEGRNDVWSKH